ncbi:EndoU domain-containing protein [Asticcacaulis solisilvae]|uniref:EndoU domain-containing protein n=1 Tax=Asticcacaulis solisilvae TaxID=1217274 RepID=UPI003FD8C14E
MPVSLGQNVITDAARSLESLLTAKIRANIAQLPFPVAGPSVPSVGLPHPGGPKWERAAAIETATRDHPVVRRAMADPNFAKVAHDDVKPLTGIEKAVSLAFPAYDDDTWWNKAGHLNVINGLVGGVQHLAGNRPGDAQNSYSASLARGFGNSIYGLAELADADTRRKRADIAAGKVPFVSPDSARLYDPNGLRRLVSPLADALIARGDALDGKVSKPTVVTQASGVAGTAAPGVVALVPGGQPVAAAYFAGQGAHAVADKARQAGTYGTPGADTAMGANAVFQAGLSALPLERLAGPLIPAMGGPIKQWLAAGAVKTGLATAQATAMTTGQNGLVKTMIDPKQDLLEGEGDNAGTMAFLALLAHLAHGSAAPVAKVAAGTRARLGTVAENARASALRTRAPEVFKRVVQVAAGNGPAKTVYVRPKPFVEAMQTPKGDSVLAAMPELADKTREALASDSHIAIPVEDLATHIAPSDAWDGLADHLTLSPDHMSLAEVHDDARTSAEAVGTEYANAQAAAGDPEDFARSTQAVADAVRGQLDAANPFAGGDNAARADLAGQIYAVQASREGKAPENLYRQTPVPPPDVEAPAQQVSVESPPLAAVRPDQMVQSMEPSEKGGATQSLRDGEAKATAGELTVSTARNSQVPHWPEMNASQSPDVSNASGAEPDPVETGILAGPQFPEVAGPHFLRFSNDVEPHIIYRDVAVPRRNGIGGAHNFQEFMRHAKEFEVVSSMPHADMPGVSKIEYQLYAKDAAGNQTGTLQQRRHVKTVYDPSLVSDTDILAWGRQAAAEAQAAGNLNREWVGKAPNGLVFRGYLDSTGAVRTYFPDF